MRLLELRTNGSESPTVEFHPNLTVVYGLNREGREAVIRAIEGLPAGDDVGMTGLLEAHGILFDLNSATLGVLGYGEAVDVVVRADDLPGPSEQMASVTPLFGDTAPPEAGDDGDAGGDAPDLDDALAELARAEEGMRDAEEALGVMVDAFERAKLERAAAIEASQRIQQALDKARTERDIARAQRDGKIDENMAATERHQQLRERLQEMLQSATDLQESIKELEERDPRPIQVLVDALHQPQSDRLVPSQEAIGLADEFAELQRQLDELERRLQQDGLSMDQLASASRTPASR
jgi:hypothetical protein